MLSLLKNGGGHMEPFFDLSASDTSDTGQAWNQGGSDEAMMTVKDGVRRGMRVKQLAKELRPSLDLNLLEAEIYPPSLARGVWPEDYLLSDHGFVTCTYALRTL